MLTEKEAIALITNFDYSKHYATELANIHFLYQDLYGDKAYLAINYPTTEFYHKDYIRQLKKMVKSRKLLMIKNSWIKRRAKDGYYKGTIIDTVMDVEYLKTLTVEKMLTHPIMLYTTHLGKIYVDTYRRKGPPYHGTTNKQKIKVFYIRKNATVGYYEGYDNRKLLILSTPEILEHPLWELTNSIGKMKKGLVT